MEAKFGDDPLNVLVGKRERTDCQHSILQKLILYYDCLPRSVCTTSQSLVIVVDTRIVVFFLVLYMLIWASF